MVNVRKRGKVYEYRVEVASVEGKRKWLTKSRFKSKSEAGERQVYICDTLLKALKNYKEKQEINKKKYKKEYYSYCLEEVKNKYGKIVEYRIIEVKDNRRLSNKINLVFTNRCGKYSGTESIRYPFKVIHNGL